MGGRSHQFAGLRWGAGFTTGAVTIAIANAIAIALGFVAKALQNPVDELVFERVDEAGNTEWTDVLETLTQMGNVAQTQYLGAALAVGFAIWFALQGWRWWMPLLLFPVAVDDRDRDVESLIGTQIGAFPSGGCARIMIISGAAVVLASYYAGLSRRTTRWLYVIPLILGLAEGYFRTRLNQHWFTDVVGGILYGGLMLAALARTLWSFDPEPAALGLAHDRNGTSPRQADVLGANP